MPSVNKVILIGNLGRDPEVRYTPDGAAVCNVSIATTTQWKDKTTGERRDDTEWHKVVFYNRLAEIVGEYLKKGRSVYVEGRLRTRKWQDRQTGQDRYATEIVADQMRMLSGVVTEARSASSSHASAQHTPSTPAPSPPPNGGSTVPDDDIPFAPYGSRRAAAYL